MTTARLSKALLALSLLCSCHSYTLQLTPATRDVGVETGLKHTIHMKEGCTAVDMGAGMVVTAKHCVDELKPGDDTSVGMVVYQAPLADFAVLFDTARLDNPRPKLRSALVGERLYVVGYPMQLATREQALTVTEGIFAGPLDEENQERITAAVYFGNSGGGCWGTDGALLGITVAGFMHYQGMSFMVPAKEIKPWLPR